MLHEPLTNGGANNNKDVFGQCKDGQFSTTDSPFLMIIDPFMIEGGVEACPTCRDP